MNLDKYIPYIRVVIGIVFIISGFAKAFDADLFASILTAYGVRIFYGLAPIIIFSELLLGLALLFGIYPRNVALITAFLIIVFTIGYSYGLFFIGIKDCGCFGRMHILDASPAFIYLRNILLFCGLVFIAMKSPQNDMTLPKSTFIAGVSLMFAGAFICGNTFHWRGFKHRESDKFDPIAVAQHPLRNFIRPSVDSTYMITVFSYTCPHCLNSIGNIEQYEKFGVVDRVIGIALENSEAEEKFLTAFQPSFCITNYPFDTISKLTVDFPMTFFVKQNYIIGIMSGEVPSAFLFNQNDRIGETVPDADRVASFGTDVQGT